jgi:hypothetical protein
MTTDNSAQAVDAAGFDPAVQVAPRNMVQPERAFRLSMLVSAIRCTLTYVLLPFFTPLIGLAPGVGPGLGVVIGTVAIVANVYSLRRFWRVGHRLRRPITVLHVAMIGLLVALIAVDLNEIITTAGA